MYIPVYILKLKYTLGFKLLFKSSYRCDRKLLCVVKLFGCW